VAVTRAHEDAASPLTLTPDVLERRAGAPDPMEPPFEPAPVPPGGAVNMALWEVARPRQARTKLFRLMLVQASQTHLAQRLCSASASLSTSLLPAGGQHVCLPGTGCLRSCLPGFRPEWRARCSCA
jgi:hypothetical protein